MIKMVNGSTRVKGEIKNAKSGPFSAGAEIEARLVKMGVAEYIRSGDKAAAAPKAPEKNEPPKLTLKALEEMSRADLESLAADKGIDEDTVKAAENKKSLAKLIIDVGLSAESEGEGESEGESEGEELPELGAEAPVQ